MIPDLDILEQRIEQYISARSLKINEQLGLGYDGVAYSTRRNTAIKALRYEKIHRNELNVYLWLQSQGISLLL